jgi:hypothetical protein
MAWWIERKWTEAVVEYFKLLPRYFFFIKTSKTFSRTVGCSHCWRFWLKSLPFPNFESKDAELLQEYFSLPFSWPGGTPARHLSNSQLEYGAEWMNYADLIFSGQSVPVRSRGRVAGYRWEEVSDTNLISGHERQTWGRLGRETPARDGKNHSVWRRKYPIIQFYLLERDADTFWDLCCTRKEKITHHKSIGWWKKRKSRTETVERRQSFCLDAERCF